MIKIKNKNRNINNTNFYKSINGTLVNLNNVIKICKSLEYNNKMGGLREHYYIYYNVALSTSNSSSLFRSEITEEEYKRLFNLL